MAKKKQNADVITFPIHMKAALDKSLQEFARQGFHYDIFTRIESESQIYMEVDSTVDHAIALGIKIGYNLKAEEHGEEKQKVS